MSGGRGQAGGVTVSRYCRVVFGVPDVVISLTLFALGTSLPELATAIVAALKRQGDIITGNAIGSCIFQYAEPSLVVTAAVKPVSVGKAIAWLDMGVMLGLTSVAIIVPLMWTQHEADSKAEGAVP